MKSEPARSIPRRRVYRLRQPVSVSLSWREALPWTLVVPHDLGGNPPVVRVRLVEVNLGLEQGPLAGLPDKEDNLRFNGFGVAGCEWPGRGDRAPHVECRVLEQLAPCVSVV